MNSNKFYLILIISCIFISSVTAWLTIRYITNSRLSPSPDTSFAHEVNYPISGNSNEILASLANLNSAAQGNFILAAKKSTPAVVFIESVTEDSDNLFMLPNKGLATGSGVLISPDGYIVTNNHVVENADKIQVLLNNNRQYVATLVGTDPTTDVAVIKIEASDLPYLELVNGF
jgi:S1-C subfamily serine protease